MFFKRSSPKSMPFGLEYHVFVRRSIPASVAVFSLLALPMFSVPTTNAQINGAPASVTSPGFGGRAINGTPPSVTSLGTRGNISNSRVTFSTQHAEPRGEARHRHHHFVTYTPPIGYAIPVPYAVDIADTDDDPNDNDSDANYQGGPTVFDRRRGILRPSGNVQSETPHSERRRRSSSRAAPDTHSAHFQRRSQSRT